MSKKKETKENKDVRYCSHCGTQILSVLVGAETVFVYGYYSQTSHQLASAYDQMTGERNYVREFRCPQFEDHWWRISPHDNFHTHELVKVKE